MREKLNMSFLELRAALQSGLDHALVEFGEADLEEFQIGQWVFAEYYTSKHSRPRAAGKAKQH